MLKAILFDLDETLLDWSGRTINWEDHEAKHLSKVHRYVSEHICPLPLDEEAFMQAVLKQIIAEWGKAKNNHIAPHLGHILVKVLVDQGVPPAEVNTDLCVQVYDYHMIEGVRAYPEVSAVLGELQTYPLQFGIITNALHPMLLRDVDLAGADLLQFFPEANFRLSAADVGYLKPHPKIFEELLARMALQPDEAVFVGDSLGADIKGAKAVGLRAIWRKNTPDWRLDGEVPTPDATLTDLRELPSLLDELFPHWREAR